MSDQLQSGFSGWGSRKRTADECRARDKAQLEAPAFFALPEDERSALRSLAFDLHRPDDKSLRALRSAVLALDIPEIKLAVEGDPRPAAVRYLSALLGEFDYDAGHEEWATTR